MVIWLVAQPRTKYEVSYRNMTVKSMNVIPKKLVEARRGNVQSQKYLIRQFVKAYGLSTAGMWIEWHDMKFIELNIPGRPPKQAAKPGNQPQLKQGCTCERDCGACNQGWHSSCRYNCQYGEPLA
ncbi:MAG: hypothetical protein L0H36_01845 [bacterium]|nr:hypothetical protein [bacterium]